MLRFRHWISSCFQPIHKNMYKYIQNLNGGNKKKTYKKIASSTKLMVTWLVHYSNILSKNKMCEYLRSILMKFGNFEHLHWYAFTQEHAFEWIDIEFFSVCPAIIHRFLLVICANFSFVFIVSIHWITAIEQKKFVKSEQKNVEKHRKTGK